MLLRSILRSEPISSIGSAAGLAYCSRLIVSTARPDTESSAIETPSHVLVASVEALDQVLPISHELGKLRRRNLETKGVIVRYAEPGITAGANMRMPANSWLELTYPFSASQVLREQYQRFNTELIRMGLILEDVDGFAGDIAHRHVNTSSISVVTASVDKITWLQTPPEGSVCLKRDLRLTGQVSWTGTSSMEVLIEAHTRAEEGQRWDFGGSARFVMVGRANDSGQSVAIPTLLPQTKQQHNLFALGHYNRQVRKRKRETSLAKSAPSPSEVAMLHSLMQAGGEQWAVSIASTRKHSVRLMNSQDRNVAGLMYGGYLLREAFELAFATAVLHAKDTCEPVSIEDVAFLQPVHIGSIVEFTAQVAYAASPLLRVNVRASTLGTAAVVTNDFTVSFRKQRGGVSPVVPQSIADAWLYIQGHRQHQVDQAAAGRPQDRIF